MKKFILLIIEKIRKALKVDEKSNSYGWRKGTLLLAALIMVGCNEPVTIDTKEGLKIVNIDSCEYIKCPTYGITTYVYSHKGNCRFCKERRKKELEELVIKLKEK